MGLLIEDLGGLEDLFGLDLPVDYESAIVEQLMWGDTDYGYAYLREADGIWADQSLGLGMVNMDLSAWFKPFNEGRDQLHPFVMG